MELPFVPDIAIDTDQINALVLDVWDILAAACLGALVNAVCRIVVPISTVDNTGRPAILSDVEEKAKYTARSLSGKVKEFTVPTIDESLFTDDGAGEFLDYGFTEVTGIISLLEDGVVISGGDMLRATDYHGSPLVTFLEAKQDWGK